MNNKFAIYVLAAFLVGVFIGYYSGYDTGLLKASKMLSGSVSVNR